MNNANFAGSNDPRPQTMVESALGSVARGIDELASAIDALGEGASSVLRPSPPSPPEPATVSTKQLSAIEPEHCHVVKTLHGQRREIEHLVNRVNELRNRLEA